ncbi:cytochrome b/b6 domain-containing protein [Vibrio anguillarum]|uniref:cytochrome b/b6 domain-containing protein n=1 Tax=Vibrio anguillarum TaxID=55601 RepID=UPI00038F251D|nr:cytochrome b/b6 domain-containing protein [Vibrio anguillarum]AGU58353.1 cytochrome B [Vibrio anguillarum M3]
MMKMKSKSWDPVVKVTHWVVATLFLLIFFLTKAGSDIHQYTGYTLVAFILIRLAWGCIAPPPARLTSFSPSISNAMELIVEVLETRKDKHLGHNPAGAVMIWCMWTGLIIAGISGFIMDANLFGDDKWVKLIHHGAVNITFVCVCIHVGAVIVMGGLTGRSYILSILPRCMDKKLSSTK